MKRIFLFFISVLFVPGMVFPAYGDEHNHKKYKKPGKPKLISPKGETTQSSPVYIWKHSKGATSYQLWIKNSNGTLLKQWYTADDLGCGNDSLTCGVTPSVSLKDDSAKWKVRAANLKRKSGWSKGLKIRYTGSHAPITRNDSTEMYVNTSEIIDVLANDSDHENDIDPSSCTIITNPAYGNVDINLTTGAVTYTPEQDFTGLDKFAYQVSDLAGHVSNPAWVFITVDNVNNSPYFTSQPINNAVEKVQYQYLVAGFDADNGATLNIEGVLPSWLKLDDYGNGTGLLSGTPSAEDIGTHHIELILDDGIDTSSQFFNISVEELQALPQDEWTVRFVDSEEVVGSNGGAVNAIDGNPSTRWHTEWYLDLPPHPHEIQLDLGRTHDIYGFRYLPRQDFNVGMIYYYELYVSPDGVNWGEPAVAGCYPFENYFEEKETVFQREAGRYVRLVILGTINAELNSVVAELNILGKYRNGGDAPESTIDTPIENISVPPGTAVLFSGSARPVSDSYTGGFSFNWIFEGQDIANSSIKDPGEVIFSKPGIYTVRMAVTDDNDVSDPSPATRVIKVVDNFNNVSVAKDSWQVKYVDSEERLNEDRSAEYAFDNDENTFWHTEWSLENPLNPHEMIINLGSPYEIDTFTYLPRQDQEDGRIADYHFYISEDGKNWGAAVSAGTFTNNSIEQNALFAPKWGQFVKFVSANEVNGNAWASAAEIGLAGTCDQPYVRIINPLSNSISSQPDLTVNTSVCLSANKHTGWGLLFSIDGGLVTQTILLPDDGIILSDTFTARFSGLSLDEHEIEVFIVNQHGQIVGGEKTYDKVENIFLGDYYVAIGDSITMGFGDDEPSDNVSLDGRNATGGFGPILNNLLTADKGYAHSVVQDAYWGEPLADGLANVHKRIEKNQGAKFFLIMYGSNDNLGELSKEEYRAKMQQIIDIVRSHGKEAYIAKIPYSLYLNTNSDHEVYNTVIDELVVANGIKVTPPDFFNYFKEHTEEIREGDHPNGIGYQSMARLWYEALTAAP